MTRKEKKNPDCRAAVRAHVFLYRGGRKKEGKHGRRRATSLRGKEGKLQEERGKRDRGCFSLFFFVIGTLRRGEEKREKEPRSSSDAVVALVRRRWPQQRKKKNLVREEGKEKEKNPENPAVCEPIPLCFLPGGARRGKVKKRGGEKSRKEEKEKGEKGRGAKASSSSQASALLYPSRRRP